MRKYDEDYKREALRKIHDGQSVASVARELGVAESLLHNWKRQAVETSSASEREVLALKKRIRELEMEREILEAISKIGSEQDQDAAEMHKA